MGKPGSVVSEETEQGCDPSHICPGKTFNSNPFYQMEGGKKYRIYMFTVYFMLINILTIFSKFWIYVHCSPMLIITAGMITIPLMW